MTESIINSHLTLEAYKTFLDVQFEKYKYLRLNIKTGRQRTQQQNAALHLFCTQLADVLNDAGFDFRTFVKPGYPVPFNAELVKEYIWRPIQKIMFKKESTMKLNRDEVSKVYDVLNAHMAEHGIFVAWPSKDKE